LPYHFWHCLIELMILMIAMPELYRVIYTASAWYEGEYDEYWGGLHD